MYVGMSLTLVSRINNTTNCVIISIENTNIYTQQNCWLPMKTVPCQADQDGWKTLLGYYTALLVAAAFLGFQQAVPLVAASRRSGRAWQQSLAFPCAILPLHQTGVGGYEIAFKRKGHFVNTVHAQAKKYNNLGIVCVQNLMLTKSFTYEKFPSYGNLSLSLTYIIIPIAILFLSIYSFSF